MQQHEIDIFCIGTNVVTCEGQPALGAVYKLCEINGKPCIKVAQDVEKVSIPGRKSAYRLFNQSQVPVTDLLVEEPPQETAGASSRRVGLDDEIPAAGKRVLCKHPFDDVKRAFVTPSKVVPLHNLVYGPPTSSDQTEMGGKSQLLIEFPTIDAVRNRCASVLLQMCNICAHGLGIEHCTCCG